MEILFDYEKNSKDESYAEMYELLSCVTCKRIILRSHYWYNGLDPSEVEFNYLYPSEAKVPLGLPKHIKKAYEAAQRIRNIDPNSYGVLLGRLLEMICEDKNAKGETLNECLKDLATRNIIPEKLVGVAKGLKDLRNVAAHAFLGELTSSELPTLDALCNAILEYVYSAPYLIKRVEFRLQRLKNIKRNSKVKQNRKQE